MIFSLHCYPMYIIRKERCPGTRGLRSRDLETVKVLGPKVVGINKLTNWKRPGKLEILVKSKFYKKRGATFLMTSHISSVMVFLTTSLHKNCQNDVKLLET